MRHSCTARDEKELLACSCFTKLHNHSDALLFVVFRWYHIVPQALQLRELNRECTEVVQAQNHLASIYACRKRVCA